ncbi:XRE family transcriptional regulator, partial [Xanthomonas euvesicatoria pv. euvesicatoria]|nr:XRE family transcriptional regulator [Xanthomonas euvesicatoria pv. euvesicatoria]
MPIKSIHKDHYDILLQQLRELRLSAGLTQVALSNALERPQSYVS